MHLLSKPVYGRGLLFTALRPSYDVGIAAEDDVDEAAVFRGGKL